MIQTVRGVGYLMLREQPRAVIAPAARSLQGRLLLYGLVLIVAVWGASVVGHLVRRAARARRTARRPPGPGGCAAGGAAIGRNRERRAAGRPGAAPLRTQGRVPGVPPRPAGALRSANAPLTPMVDPGDRLHERLSNRARSRDTLGASSPRAGRSATCWVYVGEEQAARDEKFSGRCSAARCGLMAVALPLLALAGLVGGAPRARARCACWAAPWPIAARTRSSRCCSTMRRPRCGRCCPRSTGSSRRIGELMMESERRFTADAAHELRTPIAAIRMQAQVAAERARRGEPAPCAAVDDRGAATAPRGWSSNC